LRPEWFVAVVSLAAEGTLEVARLAKVQILALRLGRGIDPPLLIAERVGRTSFDDGDVSAVLRRLCEAVWLVSAACGPTGHQELQTGT